MENAFTIAAYVVAGVLFILSLGGLSGQESAKRAVWYGIAGMALAVFATLVGPGAGLWWLSVILIALGGVIGMQLAQRVQMTQMPELVAAMHSLVGLAAVFVGFKQLFGLSIRRLGVCDGMIGIIEGFGHGLSQPDQGRGLGDDDHSMKHNPPEIAPIGENGCRQKEIEGQVMNRRHGGCGDQSTPVTQ